MIITDLNHLETITNESAIQGAGGCYDYKDNYCYDYNKKNDYCYDKNDYNKKNDYCYGYKKDYYCYDYKNSYCG